MRVCGFGRKCFMGVLALLAIAMIEGGPPPAAAQPATIKIASLAPEGSSWMKLFHDWSDAISKRTGGAVKVKYYAGGVMGDERDVVRKMKLGQINGAAITAVGLGLIQPDVRVLELPFLFKDGAELDVVRDGLDAEFRAKFEEKGYVLLSWGDVGPMRLYSNTPLRTKADFAQLKMWTWVDDPFVMKLFQRLGIPGVPLGVPDVLPSMQTGMINACYGSPLAAVALQWHGKVKFATSMEFAQSIGAVLLTKKAFEGMTAEQRSVVSEESKKLSHNLTTLVRKDNDTAFAKMKQQGIEVVPTPPELLKLFATEGRAATLELDGKIYGKDFRERVEKAVAMRRGNR